MNTGNTVQGGLLGNMQPNRTFGSLSYNPVNPQGFQSSTPMATSVATGQPTGGSITPLISSVNPQISSPQIGPSSLSMLQKGGTIKSQTITGADGSTHSATYDTSGGNTAPKGNAQNIPVTNPQGGTSYVSGTSDALPGAIASAGGTQQSTPSTYTTPTPNPTSMQGILGSLVNTATTPNPLLTQDIQKQQELASQLGPALATVTNTPGLLANQNARASNISQAYGQEMQGLGTNISALQALQGTQQSGLTSAGQLAQPTGAFPFVFNPATGQFSAPGVGGTTGATTGTAGAPTLTYNPTQDAQTLATQVVNRKISYNDALTALSYGSNSSSAPSQLSQAVIGLGGNPTNLQAQAAATVSNIGTAGTATTNTWNSIYGTAQTQAANFSQQQSAINGIGNQVINTMQSLGINPSDSQFANKTINQVATQFSSPAYAQFNTQIQSLQARIGQALQAGEIPTAATGNAAAIANGSLSFPALLSTLQAVDKEMGTFVQTQQSLADYAKSQLGTSSSTTSPTGGTSSGGGEISAGGYSFVQNAQGQWVPKA